MTVVNRLSAVVGLWALVGCHGDKDSGPPDVDGDGYAAAADCDDADAAIHPNAAEIGSDGIDQDCDGVDELAARTWEGTAADEGFGAAIAGWQGTLLIGAPFYAEGGLAQGRVYRDGVVVLQGEPGDRVGAALTVVNDGTVLVGAPGAREVTTIDGARVIGGAGMGAALTSRGGRWAAGAANAVIVGTADGIRTVPLAATPDSVALGTGGQVAAGFQAGDVAVSLETTAIARTSVGDEAGAALLYADLDGDGHDELCIGAPGAGRVYVIDPDAPPTTLVGATSFVGSGGRFGASLAFVDGLLYVGAPMAGDHAQGALWSVDATGVPALVREGGADDDALGFTLASTPEGSLLVAAPGGPTAPGTVTVSQP